VREKREYYWCGDNEKNDLDDRFPKPIIEESVEFSAESGARENLSWAASAKRDTA